MPGDAAAIPPAQRVPSQAAVPAGSTPAVGTARVGQGDTVFTVGQREKVPLRAIIEANNLTPPYAVTPGRVLLVPPPNYYTVQRGETLYGLSRRFGVDIYTLAQANAIPAPYRIDAGRRLRIPRDADLPPPTPATAVAQATAPTPPASSPSAAPVVPDRRVGVQSPPPRSAHTFAWPVRGEMISAYGPKPGGLHNDGINIAVQRGTDVHAAENGVVVYAGNELRGYGKLLLIRHAEGWLTAYAHNDELLVRRGDTVRRGQVISRSGASGSVGSPQLHFEIRHGVQAVDPVPYLAPSV
jgi:murein DD-endopeptidase MepM/ murein hydrolase activator NlpD